MLLAGAAMARTGIDSVWIRVDEGPVRLARSGRPNTTIQRVYPDEHGPGSGDWLIAIDAGELSPGAHEIQALAVSNAGGATVATRQMRFDLGEAYRRWLSGAGAQRLSGAGGAQSCEHGEEAVVAILLVKTHLEADVAASLRSIVRQSHSSWRLALVGAARRAVAGLAEWRELEREHKLGDGEFEDLAGALDAVEGSPTTHVVFSAAGVQLAGDAVRALVSQSDADVSYCDGDGLGPEGARERPFFKPAWSPELLAAWNYLDPLFMVRAERLDLARRLQDRPLSCPYEALIRVLDEPLQVANIPAVLYTQRACRGCEVDSQLERQALVDLAARRGSTLELEMASSPERRSLRWQPVSRPLVSIVIPTAGSPEVLGPCLRSLGEVTAYENIEVVLVDTTASTVVLDTAPLGRRPWRIVPYAQPFNYSAANNLGVVVSRGEVLVFLNDDTVAVTPDWIDRMLGQLQQPGVGVVGGKLLYPEGLVQHAGVFFSSTGPTHAGVLLDGSAEGYMGMLQLQRNCAGVTGACMMTERAVHDQLGGFDEHLAVEYGDIDFCLSAQRLGLRTVVLPEVRLIHLETVTREPIEHPADSSFFRARWPAEMAGEERFFPRKPMRP